MSELRIDLPASVDPRFIVGVVDLENDNILAPTRCGLCFGKFSPGDCYLGLFDGDGEDELCPVCEKCNAKDSDGICRTVLLMLVGIGQEVETAPQKWLAVMRRISQGKKVKPLSLLEFANSVRQVERDMANWEPSPDAVACSETPF